MKNVEWKVIYIVDPCDSSADQILDTIEMDSVEKGAHEFEWEFSPPDYSKFNDKFSIFDSTAMIFSVSHEKREFLKVSYFVIHTTTQNLEESPEEEVKLELVKREVKADKPKITTFVIDWGLN